MKKKVENGKVIETKCEMNDVIETKDGFFTVLAITFFPGTYQYVVMVDGKHTNIPEDKVIAGYRKLENGSKKPSTPRKRKTPVKPATKKDAPGDATPEVQA